MKIPGLLCHPGQLRYHHHKPGTDTWQLQSHCVSSSTHPFGSYCPELKHVVRMDPIQKISVNSSFIYNTKHTCAGTGHRAKAGISGLSSEEASLGGYYWMSYTPPSFLQDQDWKSPFHQSLHPLQNCAMRMVAMVLLPNTSYPRTPPWVYTNSKIRKRREIMQQARLLYLSSFQLTTVPNQSKMKCKT